MTYTSAAIIAIAANSASGIHKGDNTHTHGQLIKPVSFNPTNKIVNSVQKLGPADEEELVDIRINPQILACIQTQAIGTSLAGPAHYNELLGQAIP